MENKLSIEQVFDTTDNNVVHKTKSSIVMGILLVVLGVIALFMSREVSVGNGIMTPLLIVAGIILTVWGIISLFFRKTYYKSTADNQKVTFNEMFFDIKERERLIKIVSDKNMKELKNLKGSTHDALKLRVACTPDGNICYAQVITYIPFEFINASEAQRLTKEDALIITDTMKNRK